MPARAPLLAKTPYAIDPRPLSGAFTPHAGLGVLSRAFRSLKLPGLIQANLSLKQRDRGLQPAQYLESLVLLHAAGGEAMQDIEPLRQDQALSRMLGYQPPSARAVGDFLERFHDPEALDHARHQAASQGRLALLVEESTPLAALANVQQGLVQAIARNRGSPTTATIDLDATIIESAKREATTTYEGSRGYQPLVAAWAETALVLADEFRDGNVPANYSLLGCARAAFAALPATVNQRYFRGDSACHDRQLLGWLADPARPQGPQGFIGFAVSARMEPTLLAAARAVAERDWTTFDHDADGTLRQWAELDYVPADPSEHSTSRPLRCLGLRLLKPQGEFFADGESRKHFAVLTNRTESAEFLLRWQRLKAGTIEHVHDELKNGVGGGRLPSGKFGANAAWWRIACLAYNLVEAVRSQLPQEQLHTAKLKRLRLHLFGTGGRLVRDRRKIQLRLAAPRALIADLLELFRRFPLLTQATG